MLTSYLIEQAKRSEKPKNAFLESKDVLDKLNRAGKPKKTRNEEALDAVLRGDVKKAQEIRQNEQAKKRAQSGDTQTLASKRKSTAGTWENAVERARKRLNVKPGEDIDSLLKSALWVLGEEDGKVSREALNETVRLMQSPEGREELQSRIERYKNPSEPEQSVGELSHGQVESNKRDKEFRNAMDSSGLGYSFRSIEKAENKIQSNPFIQMLGEAAGKVAPYTNLGMGVDLAGGDSSQLAKDATKGAISGTLTTPPRVVANLQKFVAPGINAEQRGYALAELAMDLLDVGGLAASGLKANKTVIRALLETAELPEGLATQAVKAIDEIPDEAFNKALDDLANAPEVQRGLPQNTRGIPKASVTNAVEPEIPVQQLDDAQQTVNPSELPNSSVKPDNIADSVRVEPDTPTQVDAGTPNKVDGVKVPQEWQDKVDETFLGQKASEWEQRLAELQAKPKKPRTRESGGLDPDVLEEAVLRAGIMIARAGEPIEQAIRTALKDMGLGDDSYDEVRQALDGEAEKPLGFSQADTAAIRQERGLPEYEKTTRSLDEVAQNAESVDVQKTVKDILDNPRPMTDAEEYATRQAVDANDRAYRDLTQQYNQAVESGDMATANLVADELERINAQMGELAEAADKAGSEWGRAGRARQLEIARSRDPSVIRYRQYKAVGGKPNATDQKRIDDLIDQLEKEKAAREAAEAKLSETRKTRVSSRVQSQRPPRKVEEAIKKNDDAFAEWQKRWAKAGAGGSQTGGEVFSLAIEGAYYVAKGQYLRGVKSLDEIIGAVRKAGLAEKDISDTEIANQVEKALDDLKPARKKPQGPTTKDLRNEIANRTGRVKERRKAPRKAPEGNTPKAKSERKYRTTLSTLQNDLESLQAQVSLLRSADPDGPGWMKLKSQVAALSAKINRGRAYGKEVLQVGEIGFEGDEIVNLRNSLDNLRRDFGFDDQAINAPGESYGNIIKNIEDIEADKTLSPFQKKQKLEDMYRILNQGRTDGEGFFKNGNFAIEDPEVARARAREDAVMAKINKELAKQKRKADREAASTGRRLWEDFKSVMGGIKTIMLSGEAGFLGRQAWMPIMTRPKLMIRALKDMKNSVKQEMFDWTIAELKQNPWHEAGQKAGLAITDPSSPVREEDFMTSFFEQMTDSGVVGVKQAGQALDAYSGLNERVYSAFLNRVRMDLFQEFAEAAGRKGAITDKDLEAFANIVNDMTGRSSVPPKAEATVSAANQLFISSRYYYSRLKLLSGANLWSGGSSAAKKQMAKEYARYLGSFAALNLVIQYGSEKFGWDIETNGDPRATNFGKIVFPDGTSLEMDAGMRPFANYGYRSLVTAINNFSKKTGDDRIPNYVTMAGREVKDSDYGAGYAKPAGMFANFIAIRSNPLPAFFLKDFSDGESFGNKTDVYKEIATSPTPIIARNAYERAYNKDDSGTQVKAFLLEFFGLGGDAIDRKN